MKRNILLAGIAMAACLLTGCSETADKFDKNGNSWSQELLGARLEGSSNYVSKEFNVRDFDKVVVVGPMDVDYTQRTGERTVKVNTSDNLMDLIDIHIKGRTLYVGMKRNARISFKRMDVHITGGPLKSVTLAGSGDFTMKRGMRTDSFGLTLSGSGDVEVNGLDCKGDLAVALSGSGDIDFHGVGARSVQMTVAGSGDIEATGVKATAVETAIAGSGDIKLEGLTSEAVYTVAGSGDIVADNMVADGVEASVAGSGDIICHARKSLKANVAGSGEIGYKGNPAQVSKTKGVKEL